MRSITVEPKYKYDLLKKISGTNKRNKMESTQYKMVADAEIKKLNLYIKSNNISQEDAKAMKYTRRLRKMSQYNKAQRDKKKQYEKALEEEKEQLQRELEYILDEVNELKETKANYELLQMLDELEKKNYA